MGNTLRSISLNAVTPALLQDLRELVEIAERGDLVSVVCSAQRRGGETKTIYSTFDRHLAIGQLEEMKFHLLHAQFADVVE